MSNSGRLKALIADVAEKMDFPVHIEVINDVDRILETLPNVISSDSIILDKCLSWINLNAKIIEGFPDRWVIGV